MRQKLLCFTVLLLNAIPSIFARDIDSDVGTDYLDYLLPRGSELHDHHYNDLLARDSEISDEYRDYLLAARDLDAGDEHLNQLYARAPEKECEERQKCKGKPKDWTSPPGTRENSPSKRSLWFPTAPYLDKRYDALGSSTARDDYLRRECELVPDPLRPFSYGRDDNEGWSSITHNFENDKNLVRLGMQGLTGCNIIVVISNKEVWMAHFVEETGFGAKPFDKPQKGEQEDQDGDPDHFKVDFMKMVVPGISGDATGKYKTIKSQRTNLKPGPTGRTPDEVHAWIVTGKMTIKDLKTAKVYDSSKHRGGENDMARMYPDEVSYMEKEIKKVLDDGRNSEKVSIKVHDYEVLSTDQNDCTDAQWKKWSEEAVGHILFEYDPTMTEKSWRLLVHNEEVDKGTF